MSISHLSRMLRELCVGPRSRNGATVVEFALVLPTMMAVIYGIFEVGRLLFVQGFLYFAAEEATRFATVNYGATVTEIRAVAEDRLILIGPGNISSFDVQSDLNPVDQTKLVSVQISYAYDALLPMPWDTIMLTGSSRGFIVDD